MYVTGRSLKEGDAALPGTIAATADAVTQAGGSGIAVACDHAKDADVKALFERVAAEQGRVDILVNNATFLHDALIHSGGFWRSRSSWSTFWMWGCARPMWRAGTPRR